MVMYQDPTNDDPAPGALLDAASDAVQAAVTVEPLTQADRAYLTGTAARLRAMAEAVRAGLEPPPTPEPLLPRRPRQLLTRREAARLIGVHPNSLLNWEHRGLLRPQRDHRGWRCYDRDDLARAMTIAARHPVEQP